MPTCATTVTQSGTKYTVTFDSRVAIGKLKFHDGDLDRDNHLRADLNVQMAALLNGDFANAFTYNFDLPGWDHFTFEIPSIFALLSDPASLVDGLDKVLQTIQEAFQGQIFGIKLPFIGDALSSANGVAKDIESFRVNVLQKLSATIRNNNLDLDHLTQFLQKAIFDGLAGLHLLQQVAPDGSLLGAVQTLTDPAKLTAEIMNAVPLRFLDANRNPTSIFTAKAAEFDLILHKSYTWQPDQPIHFDVGIPALGIEGDLQPRFSADFDMHFGFGISVDKGFYFVTSTPTVHTISLSLMATFSTGADCKTTVSPARVNGKLLFLALHLSDGLDLNGDGKVTASCTGSTPKLIVTPQTEELTKLYFSGSLDIVDPGTGTDKDGMLTIPELLSSSPLTVFQAAIQGGAMLRANATVDFSTLGANFANILPSISLKVMIDFPFSWKPGSTLNIGAPQIVLGDLTLDLGSFISSFAKPIFDKINDILKPLDWLIGPKGFLNMRIPLLSDLAGHTITGKDLIVLFDPEDGPKVIAFLNFVDQLYYLSGLIKKAASEGKVGLNFGDVVLFENSAQRCANATATACTPDLKKIAWVDHKIDFTSLLGGGVSDVRQLADFSNVQLPSNVSDMIPTFDGAIGSATSEFTSAVKGKTSIQFKLLDIQTILHLVMGQPADFVIIQLPQFSFNFFYRQEFPIIGPLVGTFAGGIGATITLAFGYDSLGLMEFLKSHNAIQLLDGFFIDALDPATGKLVPQATLHAEIAVGAALDLGLIEAGVEGGIAADIQFFLDDLNKDGKIRLSEIEANLIANHFNPIAVFDISGVLTFFLRAYVTINLLFTSFTETFEFARIKLLDFTITFVRPSILATQSGGVLTLAIGPNAKNRLQGNLSGDIDQTIHVKGSGSGDVTHRHLGGRVGHGAGVNSRWMFVRPRNR